MAATATLSYEVAPATVAYSAGADRQSVVTLTVTVTSGAAQAVPCRWLTFTFGHGTGSDVLTADTSTIVAAPGPTTPWAIWGSGDGVFRAVPLPPESGFDPNDSIEFVFSSIVVNDVAGDVEIEIDQDAPS